MNSFLVRRLAPFFIFTLLIEFLAFGVMALTEHQSVDWSVLTIIKTVGVLMLTSCVSFLYLMLPYVFYLLFLPQKKQNSKLDKFFTLTAFTFFVYLTLLEEVVSIVFWKEYHSSFNFIAVDYLVYTHQILKHMLQSLPIVWYLLGLLAVTLAITGGVRKLLFTQIAKPSAGKSLFYTAIYISLCALTFVNVDVDNLEINSNRYNNELSKEGTYSLFSAFWKKSLPYKDFYETNDSVENLKILKDDLNGSEVEFLTPKKNLIREIDYEKKEKRFNVVLIIMRNVKPHYLEEDSNNLIPTLSDLKNKSLFFSNVFATGNTADRTLEALLLSIPPLPGMSIISRPLNGNLYNFGTVFKEKGYDIKWIYGGYGLLGNINNFFSRNEFEVIENYKWNTKKITFANIHGIADEDTYKTILQEADKSYQNDKPFFNVSMTTSNHYPYTFPQGRINVNTNETQRHMALKYSDYALGKFLEEAQKQPWFDNTVFVIATDHSSGKNSEIKKENYQEAVLIYAPKLIHPTEVTEEISMIDVLPTLLGKMNWNYISRFFGKDIFRKSYKSRLFFSNYQKLGYSKNGVSVILSPVKQVEISPKRSPFGQKYMNEAIAYYQQASDWLKNFTIDKGNGEI